MNGKSIDVNVDLGEGSDNDAALIAHASSANIACGGHAGDDRSIRNAIDVCLERGVAIGAHPGHEDREYFGRRALDLPPDQLRTAIIRQLERFIRHASLAGALVHHVKLHGALYHQANQNPELAHTLAGAIAGLLPGCHVYTPANRAFASAAKDSGLNCVPEAFADRRYSVSGNLVPREWPDALMVHADQTVSQALEIVRFQRVQALEGGWLSVPALTLCIHGDTPDALPMLQALARALRRHQIRLQAP